MNIVLPPDGVPDVKWNKVCPLYLSHLCEYENFQKCSLCVQTIPCASISWMEVDGCWASPIFLASIPLILFWQACLKFPSVFFLLSIFTLPNASVKSKLTIFTSVSMQLKSVHTTHATIFKRQNLPTTQDRCPHFTLIWQQFDMTAIWYDSNLIWQQYLKKAFCHIFGKGLSVKGEGLSVKRKLDQKQLYFRQKLSLSLFFGKISFIETGTFETFPQMLTA